MYFYFWPFNSNVLCIIANCMHTCMYVGSESDEFYTYIFSEILLSKSLHNYCKSLFIWETLMLVYSCLSSCACHMFSLSGLWNSQYNEYRLRNMISLVWFTMCCVLLLSIKLNSLMATYHSSCIFLSTVEYCIMVVVVRKIKEQVEYPHIYAHRHTHIYIYIYVWHNVVKGIL